FKDKLIFPGSLRDNGIGSIPTLSTQWTGSIYDSSWYFNPAMEKYRKPDSLKFPFWLTPEKHYLGSAWYQREIILPKNWKDKKIELILERPHWQTSVWIDTLFLGRQNSLSTPHRFTIEPARVKPGKHMLTIKVDNAIRDIDPGINSHSITDHTQGNWNGIVGKMLLTAKNTCTIRHVKIVPDLKRKVASILIDFDNLPEQNNYKLFIKVNGYNHEHTIPALSFTEINEEFMAEIPMGNDYKTWSEFSPVLYQMTLQLKDGYKKIDSRTEVFGMRIFSINGRRFEINGIPVFLRGTTECCVFPLTGYPPANEKDWAEIFTKCKEYGLNHMRFHSYCPPEAAFIAADKAGFYLQVEGPSWANYSVTLGDGKPIDQYLMDETKRIIDTYGNHPSFCMMAYGNEPSGHYVAYLENWVDHFREYDPQRVFTGASTGRSWAIIENSDFIVRSPPRGLEWATKQPGSEFDYRDKTENQNRPYVTFEMGQWCVFPNFHEISKYTGPLKARNFELFQEELNLNHMGHQSQDFLMASGMLQVSCYKQEIEATLRTPNLAGFQLLSLNDFPGQGTALVGVLDAFWDEKGYVTGKQFSSFCNSVVPLVRMPQYTYRNAEPLIAQVEIVNFSGTELKEITPAWQLTDSDGSIVNSGSFVAQNIPLGNCHTVGTINIPLNFAEKAGKYTLKVDAGNFSNQWNIWIYPKTDTSLVPSGIHVGDILDNAALHVLEQGGKVLLMVAGKVENGKDIVQYYTPVFWNTSWFRMRPPHTTGILIDNKHPVFNDFPTDCYSDLQWWEIANRQQVMNLDSFPPGFKIIVQPVDTWFLHRRLAMLFEARVLNGSLMVCSIDLTADLKNKPVTEQLKKSIIGYMESDDFNPESKISVALIQELFEKKERPAWNSYVKENP
ncbi:MAG: beta-glucuronidase, partial [Bacteroidales bacterium]|nr:beta-glucuronidase [Bacteroidales bacterium]